MKQLVLIILLLWGNLQLALSQGSSVLPLMLYGDTSRVGVPYSKDPHVVKFKGRYLMYHSIPPMKGDPASGWNIGIAESKDLVNWTKVGEITPAPGADYEKKGLCAPGALVKDGKVHLFYQTYGNGEKDAICHAVSDDGIRFKRNPTNPIFHPAGDWTCGRAIDAEVCEFKGRYFLYFATRDKNYDIQMQGVAVAPGILISTGKTGCRRRIPLSCIPCIRGKENVSKGLRLQKEVTSFICFMPELTIMPPNKSEWRKVKTALSGNAFRKNLSLGTANQANGIPANPVILIFLPIRTDEPTCSIREITITEKPGILHKKRWFGKMENLF